MPTRDSTAQNPLGILGMKRCFSEDWEDELDLLDTPD